MSTRQLIQDDVHELRRKALWFAAILACAALSLACSNSGGGGPTAPTPSAMLNLDWGNLSVDFGNCPNVDLAVVENSVKQSYDKARQKLGSRADTVSLTGFRLTGKADLQCAGGPAYGCYYASSDSAEFRCSYENVARHELQHRFCYQLDLGCDCAMVDHPGGYDLACQPI